MFQELLAKTNDLKTLELFGKAMQEERNNTERELHITTKKAKELELKNCKLNDEKEHQLQRILREFQVTTIEEAIIGIISVIRIKNID